VNDPADQATVASPTTAPPQCTEPATPVGVPPSARRSVRDRPQRSRQARVVVRKLGPWSVLKLSFLFYLCVMVVFLGAAVILYGILSAVGALDSLTRLIRDLFADQSFEIHGDWLFTRGLAIGLGMVVLWTLINVFVVFLYNLLSDIVGGIEVTLSERR
jgi:Transmembrane domain of unknown function (DUF3566)